MPQRSRPTVMSVEPIDHHAVPLNENGFMDWIVDSVPGDKIVYYRGLLTQDRAPNGKVLDARARATLNAVARRVLRSAEHGLVLPVQKRVGPNDFLYIAVRARPRFAAHARALLSISNSQKASTAAEVALLALAA
jgi:hypothetical protein